MRIVVDDARIMLDPPMTECPSCGGDAFRITGRASGTVTEIFAMRDGSVTTNENMWDDVRIVHDDAAHCVSCDVRLGRVIGCAPALPDPFARYHPTVRVVRIVTLAAFDDRGRILLVRKRGQDALILPGGKPEGDEDERATLGRELVEELGVAARRPRLVGVFRDAAAGDLPGVEVEVVLYEGALAGEPRPMAEIEELVWTDLHDRSRPLAPSLANLIMPWFAARARRRAR